jgi:hypothetical protein
MSPPSNTLPNGNAAFLTLPVRFTAYTLRLSAYKKQREQKTVYTRESKDEETCNSLEK